MCDMLISHWNTDDICQNFSKNRTCYFICLAWDWLVEAAAKRKLEWYFYYKLKAPNIYKKDMDVKLQFVYMILKESCTC